MLTRLRLYLRQVTSPFIYWLFLFHFLYLFQIHSTESMGGFYFNLKGISLILMSFIPVALLFYIINFVFNRSRGALLFANTVLLSLYGLAAAYHFHAKVQFEWDMFKDNLANVFYLESVIYMWSSLEKAVFNYVLVFVLIMLFMDWKYQSISRFKSVVQGWRPVGVVVVLYFVCLVTNIPCYDPISGFFKSIYVYYVKSNIHVEYSPGSYVLLNQDPDRFQSQDFNSQTPPNVFLIVVESLNQSIMHKKAADGQPVTPFLNKLSRESLVVKNFYANSIQSARGHLSIFMSLIPSITDKVTTQYDNLNTYSLADALAENGYESVIFQAYDLNGFDNVQSFFGSRGFKMESVKPYIQPEDKPYVWRSWGPEDRVFFKRFFDYYDQGNFADKPMFFSLVTIASHFPFSSVPKERRLLYPSPTSIHEEYANSLHLVDQGIEVFFKELKARGLYENSIVIITSDHTIPMGEHGIYHQEAGYYEESFRVPFMIHWPQKIKPQVIERAFSQMDIVPTILDLLDAKVGKNSFMGNSVFSKETHPIFLIQPYGKHLSVVRWPKKFLWHGRTGQISVFDLKDDPTESKDIYSRTSDDLKAQFKDDLETIYLVQKLYKMNEVYKK
ncbi:MAG: LTA synthase family protein [Candidatus Marinamargulisbacteria bacterium]